FLFQLSFWLTKTIVGLNLSLALPLKWESNRIILGLNAFRRYLLWLPFHLSKLFYLLQRGRARVRSNGPQSSTIISDRAAFWVGYSY
ncbi:MAG TPA: hypothetical protein DDW65_23450, partial [Firmicutes bacterium]|nr:hypothetical protein [Bacillota bacterium]